MKPQTMRRFVVAAAVVLGATTASSASAACTFKKQDLTYSWTERVEGQELHAAQAAIRAWSDRTNVNFTLAARPRKADVLLNVADVQGPRIGRPAGDIGSSKVWCSGRGRSKRAKVFFDTQWVAGSPSYDMRRVMAGHEIGHALGLDHDPTTAAGKPCWNGQPRPASLMYPTLVAWNSGVVCGPIGPSGRDVRAINALYP